MPAGYGNDNNIDGNSHDEDLIATTWKILLIYILKFEPRAEG